jgi:hypothetical protein
VLQPADQIAEEIKRYCIAHPGARDTIAGIAWWVQLQRQADLHSSVAAAVQMLVRQGILERYEIRDGSELYGSKRPADGE